MAAKWSERARLPRGHHTHAVGHQAGYVDRRTACDRTAEHGNFLPDDTPATCPGCLRSTHT